MTARHGDGIAVPLPIAAPPAVLDAIARLGRTEDIAFSPDRTRLAIAAYTRSACCIIDIDRRGAGDVRPVRLTGAIELTSPAIRNPHGIAFAGGDALAVANRSGRVALMPVPAAGGGRGSVVATPIRTLGRAGLFHKVRMPGAVAVAPRRRGGHTLLVCHNFASRVTRHHLDRRFRGFRGGILIEAALDIPDAIAVTADGRWIAVSNHGSGEVFVYDAARTGRTAEPAARLRGIAYPHGLCFAADGTVLFAADAGAPCIQAYRRPGARWDGVLHPADTITTMDDATFRAGQREPEEGGPKGIDIDEAAGLLATTSEQMPLAFFDVSPILGGRAGDG